MSDEPPRASLYRGECRGTRRGTRPGWPCPEAVPAELAPGALVGRGRFVVGALLGRGGMATVYAGHDRHLDREVALKVMLGDPEDEPALACRFEREAGLVARLPLHPGLLRWLGAGRLPELSGRPFLATERVPGPTLAFHMAAALCMQPREVVHMGLGLAEALVAAHGVGIVHRDLTARNVVLGPALPTRAGDDEADDEADDEGMKQPVLVDFGLAAVVDLDPRVARLTLADQRPGTVTAMAPEQYRGAAPHPAMDVYALGRLLHQMLTGEDPHATVSRARLLELHREGVRVVPRLEGWSQGAPSSLGSLIDACTEPVPRRRPSAEEVCGELRALAQELAHPLVDGGSATVISFPGSSSCSTEVPVLEASVRGPMVPRRVERSAAGWGRALLMGMVGMAGAGMVGMVGMTEGPLGSPAADGLTSGETIVGEAIVGDEAPAVAWPSTVVPLQAIEGRAFEPANPALMRVPLPAQVQAQPAPSSESRVRSGARRASPTSVEPSVARCEEQRQRARAAARRWAWAEVLESTTEPTCWPEPSSRARLRLVAWIEQQRFDACVSEGVAVRDPALMRLVERCRRRLARTDIARPEGGTP